MIIPVEHTDETGNSIIIDIPINRYLLAFKNMIKEDYHHYLTSVRPEDADKKRIIEHVIDEVDNIYSAKLLDFNLIDYTVDESNWFYHLHQTIAERKEFLRQYKDKMSILHL